MKFRKKPVEIEAVQFTGDNADEILSFVNDTVGAHVRASTTNEKDDGTCEVNQHYHPTQKPVALMRWQLEMVKAVGVVLDPFMGSGTTLRAAKDLGLRAIGIEVEEKYCEVAVQRLSQEVLAI